MGVWEGAATVLAGRYRLDELIGRGGTGEVWRGYDLRPGWAVAVKILSPEVADAATRERFAREARTAARVVHPNVVTVLDMGEHEGRPYLVMELLTGRDLAAELAGRGPLSVSETCHLAGQAAFGLDAAHRAGVVHRDVKPANLHLGAGGTLKVVDFGTARVATEAAMRLTSAGSVIGTAAYLSPEQILGEPGTAASDLYALGCVCYELLCGRPPFVGPATEVISRHVGDRPDPLRRYRPDVPVELERLVLALLEKDPAARPAGGEVVRQVTAAARHAPSARDAASRAPTATYGTAPPAASPGPTPASGPMSAPMSTPMSTSVRVPGPMSTSVRVPGPMSTSVRVPGPMSASGPVPASMSASMSGPVSASTSVSGVLSALTRGRPPGRSAAIALGAVGVVAVLVAAAFWVSAPSDPAGWNGAGAPSAIAEAVPSGTRSAERPASPSPAPAVSRSVSAAPSPTSVRSPPAA
ncbi:protein kinase, partial [Streptosporangium sp. NPDC048865]|uniref:serine/threonine-protein kinase n=1 Tax=Streptosporangium sp. NPDC048865 TaxID=3155766 RepID=UPI003431E25B